MKTYNTRRDCSYDHCIVDVSTWWSRLLGAEQYSVGIKMKPNGKMYIFTEDHLHLHSIHDRKYKIAGCIKKEIACRNYTVLLAWLNHCVINRSTFKDPQEFLYLIEKISTKEYNG